MSVAPKAWQQVVYGNPALADAGWLQGGRCEAGWRSTADIVAWVGVSAKRD